MWGQGEGFVSCVPRLLSCSPRLHISFLLWPGLLAVEVFPASTPGRQRSCSVCRLPAARHGGQRHTTSSGRPLCRGAHSRLWWQRLRASRRPRSTRSTLLLVELQPMRPIRRTWEDKGEHLPAAPTFAAVPQHRLPPGRAASGRVQTSAQSRGRASGGHVRSQA